MKLLSIVALAALLVGCATQPGSTLTYTREVSRQSLADPWIFNELVSSSEGVFGVDKARYPQATERTIVRIRTVFGGGARGIEEWVISHGAERGAVYQVSYVPTQGGGTSYSVSPLNSSQATQPSSPVTLHPLENPSRPTPEGVYAFSRTTKKPELVHMEQPRYPEELRIAGIQGNVLTDFILLPDGSVSDAMILKAPDTRFADAALDAIRLWKFTPAVVDGHTVKCHMQIVIKFTVNNS